MAGGNDEVDVTLARQLAWTLNLDPAAGQKPSPTLPPDPETAGAATFDVDAFVEQFEAAVDSAWAAPLDEQQTRYLKLVASFGRQRRLVGRLPPSPTTLKFARLHLRHRAAFVPGTETDWGELLAFATLPVGLPDTVEFLVDALECADPFLVDALDAQFGVQDWSSLLPTLGRRLVPLVAQLQGVARHHALNMLASGRWPEARAPLLAALLGPSLPERLLVLVKRDRHGFIDEDVLVQLLDDLLVHVPPLDSVRQLARAYGYEFQVITAVTASPTPRILDALGRLLAAAGRFEEDWHAVPDRTALKALARLEPARVLPRIDALVSSPDAERRLTGVMVTDWLPDTLARPRLRRLATDLSGIVAESAREKWEARFTEPAPGPRGLGPFEVLVDAEQRPRAMEWLRLVDEVGDENHAHLAFLLTKAPDPAALAVLGVLLGAGYSPPTPTHVPLPTAPAAWARLLARRWPPHLVARTLLELGRVDLSEWDPALREILDSPRTARALVKPLVALLHRWWDHFDPSRRAVAIAALPTSEITSGQVRRALGRLDPHRDPHWMDSLRLTWRTAERPELRALVRDEAVARIEAALARTPPDVITARAAAAAFLNREPHPVLERLRRALVDDLEPKLQAEPLDESTITDIVQLFRINRESTLDAELERWVATVPIQNALLLFDEAGRPLGNARARLEDELEAWLDGRPHRLRRPEDAAAIALSLVDSVWRAPRSLALADRLRDATSVAELPAFHLERLNVAYRLDQQRYAGLDGEPEPRDAKRLSELLALPGLSRVDGWRLFGIFGEVSSRFREDVGAALDRITDPEVRARAHEWLGLPPLAGFWRDDPSMPGEPEWFGVSRADVSEA